MAVDVLYLSHNRLRFTQASFAALVENTNWDLVRTLFVMDDGSVDGTREWLYGEAIVEVPATVALSRMKFGGPVAAMNHYLDIGKPGRADMFAKIDSDVLPCPRWLDIMVGVLDDSPKLDALGMEPGFGEPVAPLDVPRTYKPARHIGGVGVFRASVFRRRRPNMNNRWFGLTQFWENHASCGWVTPDLPVPLLDHLPFEPWRTLAEKYVVEGWARPWPAYTPEFEPYWSWWSNHR